VIVIGLVSMLIFVDLVEAELALYQKQ